jgi:3-isopropylmalate dehydrogenase
LRNESFVELSCIEGDGIGPELFEAARVVLDSISDTFSFNFHYVNAPAGDRELGRSGKSLPKSSLEAIEESDACLKAPVGETAKDTILKIRRELDLYANLRPAKNLPFVGSKFSNVDLIIVRENTEDLYVGRESIDKSGRKATALKVVTKKASLRIAKYAFELALLRHKEHHNSRTKFDSSVVCVSKSNVLPKSDGLFVKCCESVSKKYPSVQFSNMYVDSAAMNLVRNPEAFDVIVTSNMYGDILSDEASQIVGGLGLAPSANMGEHFALFEPVHGAAPDIAGKGIANPIAMFLSIKMMLDWLANAKGNSDFTKASRTLEEAIRSVSASGVKTPDIGGNASTDQVARAISQEILRISSERSPYASASSSKRTREKENVMTLVNE